MTERPAPEAREFIPPELQEAFRLAVVAHRNWEWIRPATLRGLTEEELNVREQAVAAMMDLRIAIDADARAWAKLWRHSQ